MRDYIIATDSCCDFDENLIRELDLTVIPLSVHLGQDHFRNYPGEMPESHVFYTRLSKGEPAQTSAPNVEAFRTLSAPSWRQERTCSIWGFPLPSAPPIKTLPWQWKSCGRRFLTL